MAVMSLFPPPTASGKTEAAFLPICSALFDDATTALGVIYISPLKALINDQNRRLEELFECIDAPVTPWHGDISAHVKRRFITRPRGALLITPESHEAMFVNRGSTVPRLVNKLRFIVVDELHAFIGTEARPTTAIANAQARIGCLRERSLVLDSRLHWVILIWQPNSCGRDIVNR